MMTVADLDDADEVGELAEQYVRSWLGNQSHDLIEDVGTGLPPDHDSSAITVDSFAAPSDEYASVRRRITVVEAEPDQTVVTRIYAISVIGAKNTAARLIIEGLQSPSEAQLEPSELTASALTASILEERRVLDGGTRITARPQLIYEKDDHAITEAFAAIMDPHRRGSVIVASPDSDDADWTQINQSLSRSHDAAATTFTLWPNAIEMLNAMLPEHLRVPTGSVRAYSSQVDASDPFDGNRHRLFGASALSWHLRQRSKTGRLTVDAFLPSFHTSPHQVTLRALPPEVHLAIRAIDEAAAKAERQQEAQRVAAEKLRGRAERELGEQSGTESDPQWWGRLRELVLKWLSVAPVSTPEAPAAADFDALDAALEEKEHLSVLAEKAASSHLKHITQLEARLDESRNQEETLRLELYERQEESDALLRRSEYYRAQLVKLQRADLLVLAENDDAWEAPANLEQLVEFLDPASENRSEAAKYVRFTGLVKDLRPVAARDPWGTMARDIWNMIHALHDYAELKTSGAFTGNMHDYLTAEDTTGFQVSAHRHASRESDQVQNNHRWFEARIFPVPTDVNPAGTAYMGAHFRVATRDSFAPRLHYLDDTAQTGKIYVGFIGKHLPNAHTN